MLKDKLAYKRAWRERRQSALPKIPCECSCGTLIPSLTLSGNPAHFVKGHHSRGKKTGQPARNRLGDRPLTSYERHRRYIKKKRASTGTKPCACGCGTLIPVLNALGKTAKYAINHAPGGVTTRFHVGQKPWNAGIACPSIAAAQRGKIVSLETRAKISTASLGKPAWNKGKPHPMRHQGNKTSYARGGFREDIGFYVRSSWEANYARLLKYLGKQFTYEPSCFVITLPDGSQRAYRPDFCIDDAEFIELRGRRFTEQHTERDDALLRAASSQLPLPLTVIRHAEYAALDAAYKFVIPYWEYGRGRFDCVRTPCLKCGGSMQGKQHTQKYCSYKCRPNNPFAGRTHSQESIQRGITTRRANHGGRY